jgi:hypothetical protein
MPTPDIFQDGEAWSIKAYSGLCTRLPTAAELMRRGAGKAAEGGWLPMVPFSSKEGWKSQPSKDPKTGRLKDWRKGLYLLSNTDSSDSSGESSVASSDGGGW